MRESVVIGDWAKAEKEKAAAKKTAKRRALKKILKILVSFIINLIAENFFRDQVFVNLKAQGIY
jgi:hypothetical protein